VIPLWAAVLLAACLLLVVATGIWMLLHQEP